MWLVTYFLITFIHKIIEAESEKKHFGENCPLDLCTTILQKVNTKIKNFCSSSLWTCLHHMVILRSQNKITDVLTILA